MKNGYKLLKAGFREVNFQVEIRTEEVYLGVTAGWTCRREGGSVWKGRRCHCVAQHWPQLIHRSSEGRPLQEEMPTGIWTSIQLNLYQGGEAGCALPTVTQGNTRLTTRTASLRYYNLSPFLPRPPLSHTQVSWLPEWETHSATGWGLLKDSRWETDSQLLQDATKHHLLLIFTSWNPSSNVCVI